MGIQDDIKQAFQEIGDIDAYKNALSQLSEAGRLINQTFTQGRTRIVEMQQAVADALPGINRLGGKTVDVVNIIQEVSEATNRNVIAGAESIERLYAASQIISGVGLGTVLRDFQNIGYTFEKIPDVLEESIHYVQSIGGNASEVMEEVVRNVDQLNRFQFADGVKGLTKMTAQAAMLKFDMRETFELADKVMTPEGAIETAAAFQRLGVASGSLVDPFQLMNQSINDPSGLQTSLSKVAEKFVTFDKESKRFKISRDGVQTLKELESQTGVSSKEMMKMGLAAAEMNARLKEIKPSIKFDNEEDKQYLSNIATMNEKGEYVVSIKRPGGDPEVKKLSDITQEETTKLIEEQKNAQKPLEDIQRDQLKVSELQAGDIAAIKNKILFGITSNAFGLEATEAMRKGKSTILGGLSERESVVSTKDVRGFLQDNIDNVRKAIKDAKTGDDLTKVFDDMKNNAQNISQEFGDKFSEKAGKYFEELKKKNFGMSNNSEVEKLIANELEKIVGQTQASVNAQALQNVSGVQSLVSGQQSLSQVEVPESSMNVKYDIGDLKIVHIIKPSPEFEKMSSTLADYTFTQTVNATKFKEFVMSLSENLVEGKNVKNKSPRYQ